MVVPISWGSKPLVNLPLGLAYIAGTLRKNNEVVFLDANLEGFEHLKKTKDNYYLGLSYSEILDRISKIKPQVLCLSIMFTVNSVNALNLLADIKKAFPEIITILGGAHVTIRPKETLADPNVDFIVVGEGERTVEELFDFISSSGDFSKIKGIG